MVRIRASRRTAPAAAATHDVDFPHLWRQLRAAGWTAKRPSGLANDWTYTSPDGSSHFIGEAAVVAHALTSGLLNENAQDDNAQDKNEQNDTAQHKHVDTTEHETDENENAQDEIKENERALHLSASDDDERDANTSDDDARPSQASDNEDAAVPTPVELSQGEEIRAFGLLQSVLQLAEPERAATASLRQLSDPDTKEEQKTDEPRAVLRRRVKVDVNYLATNEHSSDYESFSSGKSDDGQIQDDDQEPDLAELREVCHSPVLTFLYFMPKSLRVAITEQTNRYAVQQVDRRAEEQHAKQREGRRETVQQIRRRLKSKKGYDTHEILHEVGLLVARMLCPQQRRFAAHWSMVEDGAVPVGNFGRYMSRNRCTNILRDLHFVDNEAPRTRDKLWKLRPVVNSLQQRFQLRRGVLPSTSRRNTTRMFMPDKPHRYGSKMFMTCDSRTAYCYRFEIYAGKHRHDAKGGAGRPYDHKTGAVSQPQGRPRQQPPPVARCHSRPVLHVGAALRRAPCYERLRGRRGDGQSARPRPGSRATRLASIPRGTFKFARSVAIPSLVMFHWWDRKPVQYLCTGAIMTESTIGRKVKQLGAIAVACPQAVTDYQRWMGGVDVHDQLRLQKYSLQPVIWLCDLALVNAFLSHKEAAAMDGKPVMKRGAWFGVHQNQLLQLKTEDFAGVVATPLSGSQKRQRTPIRVTHQLEQRNDWATVRGVQKRRQRSCKVCALLRVDAKKSFSTTFCKRCSLDDAKLWFCNKIRQSP
uniref:PiggyBac transposable element-derived protein domain-containing protein n=1 Tax=Phytophthora ramorum TaxID=164328 RepID=H3H636_PHYRM